MNNTPTEDTIRQYLLGRLDDQEELERTLSERLLFDDQLSEMVDSIEDEIIENYLDGSVNAADKEAVEAYFLRPAERRKKLQLARLLRRSLPARSEVVHVAPLEEQKSSPQPEDAPRGGLVAHWHSHFRTYAEVAVVTLMIASTFYIVSLRRGLKSQRDADRSVQAKLESELASEREHSAKVQRALQQFQKHLFFSATYRGDSPRIQVIPLAGRMHVEIELRTPYAPVYDARLENQDRKQIWSQAGIIPSSGDLQFEIPLEHITTGNYHLLLSSKGGQISKTYDFYATVEQ